MSRLYYITQIYIYIPRGKRNPALEYIEYIQEKAWSRVHLLRSLIFVLDRKSLQTMYFSFIRPVLEYADIVWDNCTQQQINDLEKIQLEVGRIVSGITKLVVINKLYRELGWLNFSAINKLYRELGWLKLSAINKFYRELGWLKLSAINKLYRELGWLKLSAINKLYRELGWLKLSTINKLYRD